MLPRILGRRGSSTPTSPWPIGGEALSYTGGHHFPGDQDISSARKALLALAPSAKARVAKAPTAREKGYLQAVELLYGQGDLLERAIAYSEAMGRLSEQYPDDMEAAAFYALSVLRTARRATSHRQDMQAAAIAQEIFRKNPDHPGAAHYTIHAWDDPVHARLALDSARKYLKIAPAAFHALHMPSHIFSQLGLWGEMAASNDASYDASVARVERKGLSPFKKDFHALYWSQYAYLQQGRYDLAQSRIESMAPILEREGVPGRIVQQFKQMEALQVVEAEQWRDIGLSVPPATASSSLIRFEINRLRSGADAVNVRGARVVVFATGMSAVKTGNMARAREAEGELRALYDSARTMDGLVATATAVVHKELSALIQLAEGHEKEALALIEEATVLEESILPSGPAGETNGDRRPPVKPSHELYGEILLELGRPDDAAAQFETSLSRMRQRPRSLLGAARSAAQSGEDETARRYYRKLLQISGAGPDLPGLDEAKRFREKVSDQS